MAKVKGNRIEGTFGALVSTKHPTIDLVQVPIDKCPWMMAKEKTGLGCVNGDPENMFCKWSNADEGRCCHFYNGFFNRVKRNVLGQPLSDYPVIRCDYA